MNSGAEVKNSQTPDMQQPQGSGEPKQTTGTPPTPAAVPAPAPAPAAPPKVSVITKTESKV